LGFSDHPHESQESGPRFYEGTGITGITCA
jgi:hypothetical protein